MKFGINMEGNIILQDIIMPSSLDDDKIIITSVWNIELKRGEFAVFKLSTDTYYSNHPEEKKVVKHSEFTNYDKMINNHINIVKKYKIPRNKCKIHLVY